MSNVTDILLLLNLDEVWGEESEDELVVEEQSEALTMVNSWLSEKGYGQLINLSEFAFDAGDKAMQALVYGGAFDRLDGVTHFDSR